VGLGGCDCRASLGLLAMTGGGGLQWIRLVFAADGEINKYFIQASGDKCVNTLAVSN